MGTGGRGAIFSENMCSVGDLSIAGEKTDQEGHALTKSKEEVLRLSEEAGTAAS